MLTFGIIKSMYKLHADWCKTAPTRRLTRLLLTRSPDCGETPATKLTRVASSLLATSVSVSVGGSTVPAAWSPTLSLPSLTNTSDIKKLSQSTLSRVSKWHVML